MVLHGYKRRPAIGSGDQLQVVELVSIHGGGAQRPDLAGADQTVQRLHGFFHGREGVKAVDDIEVDIVRAKPAEGTLDFPIDGFFGKVPFVEIDLGGDDDLIA